MGISVGIDVVDVREVETSLERFGERYLRRLFTPCELAACRPSNGPAVLAACFAAKEAAMKALAVREESAPWRSIEVCGLDSASPSLRLSGSIARLAETTGVVETAVSISATRRYAAAVVIVQRRGSTSEENVDV